MIEFPRLPDPVGVTGPEEGAEAEEGSAAFAEMLQRSLGRNLAPGFASRAPHRDAENEPSASGDGGGSGWLEGDGVVGSAAAALGVAIGDSALGGADVASPDARRDTGVAADGPPVPEVPRAAPDPTSSPAGPPPSLSVVEDGPPEPDAVPAATTQAEPETPSAPERSGPVGDGPDEVVTVATTVSGYVSMGELATVTPIRAPGDAPDAGPVDGPDPDGTIDAPSASAPASVAQSEPLVHPGAPDAPGEDRTASVRTSRPVDPARVPPGDAGAGAPAPPAVRPVAGDVDEALARLRARLGRHDVRRGGDAAPPTSLTAESAGGRIHAGRPTQTGPQPTVPASAPVSALAARIVEIADLVEARRLPQRVIIDMPELDDVRLAVTVRGTTVTITAPDRPELPGAVRAWLPALDAALAERGLDLGGGGRRRDTGPGEQRPGRPIDGPRTRTRDTTDDDLRL